VLAARAEMLAALMPLAQALVMVIPILVLGVRYAA
jgi:hypothetical protein